MRRFSLATVSAPGAAPFGAVIVGEDAVSLDEIAAVADARGCPLQNAGSLLRLFEHWPENFSALRTLAETGAFDTSGSTFTRRPLSSLRIHAPIEAPRQILCLGANYRRHVIELMAAQASPETANLDMQGRRDYAAKMMDKRIQRGSPYAFIKLQSCVTGPFDPILLPPDVTEPDWELELAFVIGRPARYVSRADAMSYIAGYTVVNDVTARERIYRPDIKAIGTDWLAGKCLPTFLPMGPFIVPAAFVSDPMRLQITLKLNGEIMQDESTADMIFDIARQIEYLSSRIQLMPGDVVCTGSPAGNGAHFGRYLRDGDVMEGTISEIGTIRNLCVAAPRP
jgi:2-keto-4-pentenoate hydratase/2-oxohepta-3-ene-1,7-dioic acid hydratase in catechol pathway